MSLRHFKSPWQELWFCGFKEKEEEGGDLLGSEIPVTGVMGSQRDCLLYLFSCQKILLLAFVSASDYRSVTLEDLKKQNKNKTELLLR